MDGYYRKVLLPFVNQIVFENRKYSADGYYLDVDSLDDKDLQEFAMCLFKYDDCDITALYENDSKGLLVSSLFSVLVSGDLDSKINFADTARENLISFYKPSMQQLIDESLKSIEINDLYSHGYMRVSQRNSDEYLVVRG